MTREGHLRQNLLAHGRWRDSIIYAVLEDEWPPLTAPWMNSSQALLHNRTTAGNDRPTCRPAQRHRGPGRGGVDRGVDRSHVALSSSQYFRDVNRKVLRIRWMMQVCTRLEGHTFRTTSGSSFNPSHATKNTSFTPRLRRSVSTLIQLFCCACQGLAWRVGLHRGWWRRLERVGCRGDVGPGRC